MLRLPDLDHSKRGVLNSLGSPDSVRAYAFAIDDFIGWYCSEPRLAFSKHVVLRYRTGFGKPKFVGVDYQFAVGRGAAACFRGRRQRASQPRTGGRHSRVKGAKKVGVRLGNWLTVDQCRSLLQAPDERTLKGRRDWAILAILLGCGLRRAEVANLQVRHVQQREEHWALVDLMGKGRHIRAVPVPDWVKAALDEWTKAAGVGDERVFRCVNRKESVWGNGISEKVIWHIVKACAERAGIQNLAPHDCRRYAECQTMPNPNATAWPGGL